MKYKLFEQQFLLLVLLKVIHYIPLFLYQILAPLMAMYYLLLLRYNLKENFCKIINDKIFRKKFEKNLLKNNDTY